MGFDDSDLSDASEEHLRPSPGTKNDAFAPSTRQTSKSVGTPDARRLRFGEENRTARVVETSTHRGAESPRRQVRGEYRQGRRTTSTSSSWNSTLRAIISDLRCSSRNVALAAVKKVLRDPAPWPAGNRSSDAGSQIDVFGGAIILPPANIGHCALGARSRMRLLPLAWQSRTAHASHIRQTRRYGSTRARSRGIAVMPSANLIGSSLIAG